MIGNVAEWCANWHDDGITVEMELFEPRGGVPVENSGEPKKQRNYFHVARGGAWASDKNRTFSFSRTCVDTRAENGKARYENMGFRLCIPVRDVYNTVSE